VELKGKQISTDIGMLSGLFHIAYMYWQLSYKKKEWDKYQNFVFSK